MTKHAEENGATMRTVNVIKSYDSVTPLFINLKRQNNHYR